MSQQKNCLMELYANFTTFYFQVVCISSPTFALRYVRPKKIVHAFMIELDQPDY